MGETEMENEIREKIFSYGRTIFARESNQVSVICGVCGNDKSKEKRNKKGQTICEATQRDCKEGKTIQEI
tara:strand:- start:484 stop:693 length:210 start_codon:yes stop_codon:yes gene_type:complete